MPACMHIRVIMNKEKEEKYNQKRKPVKTKKIPLTLYQTCRNSGKATCQLPNEQERESES